MTKQKSHSKGSDNLTNPERLFCTLYYLTGDKRSSAKESWKCYNDKDADNKAIRALNRLRVKTYLSQLAKDSQGSQATVAEQAKKVIEELAEISFFDIGKHVDAFMLPEKLSDSIREMGTASRAISEIEYEEVKIPDTEAIKVRGKIKFHNKTQALRMLGEHHKLYTQLVDLKDTTDSPVEKYRLPDNGMSDEA